jgi:hypothetical protein
MSLTRSLVEDDPEVRQLVTGNLKGVGMTTMSTSKRVHLAGGR